MRKPTDRHTRDALDRLLQANDPLKQGYTHRPTKLKTEPAVKGLASKFKKNPLLDDLHFSKQFLGTNQRVLTRIVELERMALLKPKELRVNMNEVKTDRKYVMNDYHERMTNPGYSRNKTGGFYTS